MAEAVSISLDEMDAFLDSEGFSRLDPELVGHTCYEHVYEKSMHERFAPGCSIRIYSSIARDGQSRDVGADAIRVVLVDPERYPWCKAFKRVHRVLGWRGNLLTRYAPVLDEPWHWMWQDSYVCPNCGIGIMRCRHGKKGSFMGCSEWKHPDEPCRHTESIILNEVLE